MHLKCTYSKVAVERNKVTVTEDLLSIPHVGMFPAGITSSSYNG